MHCKLIRSRHVYQEYLFLLLFITVVSIHIWREQFSIASIYEEGGSQQLLLAITNDWEASEGSLYRYVKDEGKLWHLVGQSIPIVVGSRGLGWGRGLHGALLGEGPVKEEGDGRSPAGAFHIRQAFGHALPSEAFNVKLPYRRLTESLVCIDDASSISYNQIIEPTEQSEQDWIDTGVMMRHYDLYQWGLVVEHNAHPPIPGSGSCIFLHAWRGPSKATSGCTAMALRDMEDIVKWLEPEAHPLFIQLPLQWYRRLQEKWQLPTIPYNPWTYVSH